MGEKKRRTLNVERRTPKSEGRTAVAQHSTLDVRRSAFGVFCSLLLLGTAPSAARAAGTPESAPPSVIVAIGAPGDEAYTGVFERWAGHWQKASAAGDARHTEIGGDPKATDSLARLRTALEAEPHDSPAPLWLVLLGHGTFDGKEPKFNLRGDDLSASQLAEWLRPFHRPLVIVCGFSASGAFLKPLSGADRVVICATRSGSENNFARLGGYLSEAIADPAADLDKDGETSALEAWLAAARRVADFYKNEGRLATEHSLIDDNGDGLGTPPDWFQGVRAVKRTKSNQPPDGMRAHQLHLVASAAERALPPDARATRDALERELAQLREEKAAMKEEDYFAKLEAIMLRIARLYSTPKAPAP